mmetsp:Transcript_62745/g.101644  ORF Transcript_62745/g.101644 Transcript_62745/m.101644 type:complete len:215 (+) Transcript_62745:778-1422(+)
MDGNLDVVVIHTVQPMRLNDLQALVHHGRRIYSDFGAHVPVRMCGRSLSEHFWIHRPHLFQRHVPEGAAAAGENNLLHAALGDALQALEDGGVLGINWQHAHAVLLEHGCDHRSASDECLLVRQGNVLASLHGLDSRDQPSATDDACNHRPAVRMSGHLDLTLRATKEYRVVAWDCQGLDARLQLLELRLVAGCHQWLPLFNLLQQHLDVLACS